MRQIVSVLGPVQPCDLGFVQSHEHIALRRGAAAEKDPQLCIDDFDKSLAELVRWHVAGGQTIVEAQPVGSGRDAEWLARLSELSGVTILASTGFHRLDVFYREDHWIHGIDAASYQALLESELEEGMYADGDGAEPPKARTTHRAGLIKCAYDKEGLSPRYRRLFLAAAHTAMACDRVMMIHVENGTDPVPLQDWLLGEGVPAEQLMFCHMDRACKDLALHRVVAGRGSYLEYDTIGRPKYHSDEHEAQVVRSMVDAGLEDRLLFSLDTTGTRLKAYVPDAVGLDHILLHFTNTLLDAGVSRQVIHKMSHENPVRLFAGL